MPADECCDCERHFPGGEGLVEGRCRSCRAAFLGEQREKPSRPTRPRRKPKEDK